MGEHHSPAEGYGESQDPQAACGSCRFFDLIVSYEDEDTPADEGIPTSICRRYPPVEGWSVVLSDDWCGEWVPA